MKQYLAILLFSCFLFQLSAQDIRSISLDEAIKYGAENSISIKNAHINIADASEQIAERKAIGLPTVNGKVNYQYYLAVPQSVLDVSFFNPMITEPVYETIDFGLKNNLTFSLDAQSLIFDASYLSALKAARFYRTYVQEELSQKEQEVKNAIIQAYLPTLILEESKKILQKNIINVEQFLKETKALYKEGFVEQLDVDRLELSLANLQTEVTNLDRQSDLAYNVLKFQMGYPINEEIVATDNIDKLLVPATSEELTSAVVYENRPEYNVLQLGKQLTELNLDVNKKGYYPSLAAFGSYQIGGQGDNLFKEIIWTDVALVGLQLNVPIFDGFDKRSKINRARLSLDLINNQQRELERVITLEVENARTGYISALERVDSQQKNVDLADKIYNTTQIKYKEGVGSSLEITQAEQSLYMTQQNYTQALFDLLVAKMNLNKALGK